MVRFLGKSAQKVDYVHQNYLILVYFLRKSTQKVDYVNQNYLIPMHFRKSTQNNIFLRNFKKLFKNILWLPFGQSLGRAGADPR